MMSPTMSLSAEQIAQFQEQGFLLRPRALSPDELAPMRTLIEQQLAARIPPFELEAEVDYPGSPTAQDAGAPTIRRLLQAHGRDPLLAAWFAHPQTLADMAQLLGGPVQQTRAHHNCIMSKQPRYSSDTLWHQDVRYWSFAGSDLISVWLALGAEHKDNGCLRVLPGSHRWTIAPEQLDERLFFRSDLPANAALIGGQREVELAAGDVLYFHARLLHAATRNYSFDAKLAVVGSYRRQDNLPIMGSRSAQFD